MAIKLSGATVINDNRQIENAGPIGIGTTVGSVNVDLSIVTAKDHPLFMHSTDSAAGVVLSDSTAAWKYLLIDNIFKIKANGEPGSHNALGSGTVLVLDQYGKLGLGTNTDPSASLQVRQQSDNSTYGIRLTRQAELASYTQWIDNGARYNIGYSNPVGTASTKATLVINGQEHRLGIGTIPTVPLEVEDIGLSRTIARFKANLGTNNNRALTIKGPETDSDTAPFKIETGNSLNLLVDNTLGIHLDSTGQVGIRTDTIGREIHLGDRVQVGDDGSDNYQMTVGTGVSTRSGLLINMDNISNDGHPGTTYGLLIDIDSNRQDVITANRNKYGLFVDYDTRNAPNASHTGKQINFYGVRGDLTINDQTGISTSEITVITGGWFRAKVDSPGYVNTAYGLRGQFQTGNNDDETSWKVNNAYGVHAMCNNDSDTTEYHNSYGVYSWVLQDDLGTFNNAYGVYSRMDRDAGIARTGYAFYSTFEGTWDEKYGLYTNDEDKNYISSKLGIGNTNPTTELDVEGDVYVSSQLGIGTVNNTGSEALMIAAGADATGINLYPATGNNYTRFTFDAYRTGTGQAIGQIQWHNNNSVLSEVRGITDLSGTDRGRIDFRNQGTTMFSVDAANHLVFKANTATFIDGGYTHEMGFVTNNVPSLWVTYEGSSPRVGVGSTSTSHPFTINSNEATLLKGIRPGVNAGIALESSGGNVNFGTNSDGDYVVSTDPNLSSGSFMLKSDRSTGDLSIGGNLVVTAGNGIDFSATNDGSGGSNVSEVFDDYEEGDWTPGFYDVNSGGTAATATGTIAGSYTRIGRLVTLSLTVTNLESTGMVGTRQVYIRDLPYTVKSLSGTQRWTAAADYTGIDDSASTGGGGTLVATIQDATDYIRLTNNKSDGDSNNDQVLWSEISSGVTDIRFSITYMQG